MFINYNDLYDIANNYAVTIQRSITMLLEMAVSILSLFLDYSVQLSI